MTYDDRPPDEWGDDTGPPLRGSVPRKTESNRPTLPHDAETLRSAWISSVREFHQRRSGRPSTYNSDPQWDGGVKVANTKSGYRTFRKPIWPELVDRARAAGLQSPTDLVRALFIRWYGDSAPTPRALILPENIMAAVNLRQSRLKRIALARTAEEGVFRMAAWAAGLTTPDPREAMTFVLNDVGRELSPLFRYSLARLKNLPDVAARWRDAAESQFYQDPGSYLTYWASLIPCDLQQAASPAGTTV